MLTRGAKGAGVTGVVIVPQEVTVVTLSVGHAHNPAPSASTIFVSKAAHPPQFVHAVLVVAYTCPQSPHAGFVFVIVDVQFPVVVVVAVVIMVVKPPVAVAVTLGKHTVSVLVMLATRAGGEAQRQAGKLENVSTAQPPQSV